MRHARSTALVALLAAFAAPAGAQVAVDSVDVQIYAPEDIMVEIIPQSFTGMIGDTVTFEAVTMDAFSGDTIPTVVTWSASEGVEIDPETGAARFLTRGSHVVRATVERLAGLVIYQLQMGVLSPADNITITVGQSRQLCAYMLNTAGEIVAGQGGVCPMPAANNAGQWIHRIDYGRMLMLRNAL